VNYLFQDLGNRTSPVSHLVVSINKEMKERIFETVTIESNENTFHPDMMFESFHHQAKVSISDRALLE